MNHKKMKSVNCARIRRQLLESDVPMSRSDLTSALKLSAGAVSALVNKLIEDGLIMEQNHEHSAATLSACSGRKSITLAINPESCYYIGVELKKFNIVAVLLDGARAIRCKTICRIPLGTMEEEYYDKLEQTIRFVLQNVPDPEKLTGIGLAVAGLVSHEEGKIIDSFRVFDWHNFQLAKIIEEKVGYQVKIDSTVRCQCLAENVLGNIKKANKAVFINIERGVEAAFIQDGKLISDELFGAGFGHTTFDIGNDISKRQCSCGNTNCLQAFVASYMVIEEVKNAIRSGYPSLTLDEAEGDIDKITFSGIAKSGRNGDKLALRTFDQYNYCLGKALSNLINLTNPETVVLGGDINIALDLTMPFIERIVKSNVIKGITGNIKFTGSAFHEYGGAVGAALQLEYPG